jgi:3-oxoacyl-[acyl-carrier-protein] synthase II
MGRIALSGIGPVTPIGVGKDQLWVSVESRAREIGKYKEFSFPYELFCREITGISRAYLKDGRFRRAAEISQYALIAANLALNDSENKLNGDIALFMGITHGALGYTQTFHRAMIEEGADAASPVLFSDSVLNAPAGNTSICFNITGPVHTLVGGGETAIKSLMLARRALESGSAEKALVISAEELNELSLSCYRRLGSGPISEGAGALILEKDENINRRAPYCIISGSASKCNPACPDTAATEVINQSLIEAGLSRSDVDLILTDSPAVPVLFPDTPAGSITHLAGNAFTVSTLWHVIIAAMAIHKGFMPSAVMIKNSTLTLRKRNIMVCTAEKTGSAAAVVLSGA